MQSYPRPRLWYQLAAVAAWACCHLMTAQNDVPSSNLSYLQAKAELEGQLQAARDSHAYALQAVKDSSVQALEAANKAHAREIATVRAHLTNSMLAHKVSSSAADLPCLMLLPLIDSRLSRPTCL